MCKEHKHTLSEKGDALIGSEMPSLIGEPVLEIDNRIQKISVQLSEGTDTTSPQVTKFMDGVKKLYDNIFRNNLTH